jgi:aminomethyltransferase
LGRDALVSRTGYTGEDGWEIVVPAAAALDVWQGLLERGQSLGATAAGLGCRDTLRLEAAMPLYGHELGETVNPFQAGLPFAVEFEDHDFIGRAALEQLRGDESLPRRVGWVVVGQRPAREGNTVLAEGRAVGCVTSGTLAPTIGRPIAMGYIEPRLAVEGNEMLIDIRGNQAPARIVKLPFYRRAAR